MGKYIPLSVPNFAGNEKKYIDEAIEQGWVSSGGAYVAKLEERLADFLRVEDIAACQSGTAALHLSLIEAGVQPGDVVLVPPLTFIAAVNPVKYQRATPVFIDCDDSFCMDPVKLERFCAEECVATEEGLTFRDHPVKAVIVVHVFGNLTDMDCIMEIAARYGLSVIEDATEALGSRYEKVAFAGKYAGTIGDFGAFSFNGNKIITTGGGGAVTARDPKAVAHMRYLSTQAKDDPRFYIHHEVGYNYRMTNVQAALGVAQMEELPEFLQRKQRNFDCYQSLFDGFGLGHIVAFREGTRSNKWLCSLEINRDRVSASMREIIAALEERKIQTRAIWGLINEQRPYQGEVAYQLERAPYFANRILNLPSGTQITEEEIAYVAEQVKEVLEGLSHE